MNDILTIDGTTYNVNILNLSEKSQFADKYAERTEDWNLRREMAGIFFNYDLELGQIQHQATMQALWAKLHEITEYHDITLPHDNGLQTFRAYVTGCERPLKKRANGINTWGGFKISFIAKAPQITP